MPQGRPKKVQTAADSEWGENRPLARALLIKSRFYRIFALAFAVMGLVIFAYLYMTHIEGNFSEVLRNPSIIVILLVPFLPAIVLSLLAQKFERQFAKLGKTAEAAAAAAAQNAAPKKK